MSLKIKLKSHLKKGNKFILNFMILNLKYVKCIKMYFNFIILNISLKIKLKSYLKKETNFF